jgi:hypothetical protein
MESEEAAAEQRTILASFETRHHDQSVKEFMASERRAAAARLAEEHAAARADAHRHNIEAVRAAMAAAEQRPAQADVAGGLATVVAERQRREHQYPLPSFDALAQRQEKRCTFTSFLEDTERRHRERVSEGSRRCRGIVSRRRSDDGAGPSNAPPPPPSGASGADTVGGDSDEDVLFEFYLYFTVLCKNHLYFNEIYVVCQISILVFLFVYLYLFSFFFINLEIFKHDFF